MRMLSCLLLTCLFGGCEAHTSPSVPATTAVPVDARPTPQISLSVASWDDVLQAIAAQKGKVVVVDLWSTSCIPCVREFPKLVALHNQYAGQVVCMSVNLDFTGATDETPESHRERIMGFLEKRGATFQHFLCSDADLELYDRIDLGAVPAVYVYDQQGELKERFDNDEDAYGEEGFTYSGHINPLVQTLLEQ